MTSVLNYNFVRQFGWNIERWFKKCFGSCVRLSVSWYQLTMCSPRLVTFFYFRRNIITSSIVYLHWRRLLLYVCLALAFQWALAIYQLEKSARRTAQFIIWRELWGRVYKYLQCWCDKFNKIICFVLFFESKTI